ncbi:MAG: glycolate oxidase subunit GlcE [Candidatus Accumulibacter sp. 66-26]|nr:glycolate oxidase subunit GlcE [Accumulibacter sp.]OJW47400.1 MAG: glycolate oxidase subunit GlcE [Candidatus Accumulibacter sp. 66-26]
MTAVLEQWAGRVRAAAADGKPLRLRGGGSKDFYGRAVAGEADDWLDTREYAGIVAYEPTELVVTARCGTPLAELEAALAEKGQALSFEPPHFGAGATVGGCVVAGLAGPRRAQAGAVRDFVLGAKLLDGQGDLLAFGGQVMKNVAGYDVPRLLAGSLGTLGLIAEVSLKVLPFAVATQTLRFAMAQEAALASLNRWGGQPLPITASAWCDGVLHLRLEGAAAAVSAATRKLGGEMGGEAVAAPEAAAFWAALREQTHAFFAAGALADAPLWRLSVPSLTPPLDLPGAQLIEWGGAQRWLRGGEAATPAAIRQAAQRAGGHATLFRAGAGERSVSDVFQPLSAPLARIHRNLKTAFDPHGVFNPGRMYPDF